MDTVMIGTSSPTSKAIEISLLFAIMLLSGHDLHQQDYFIARPRANNPFGKTTMSLRVTVFVTFFLASLGMTPATADQGGSYWQYISSTGNDSTSCSSTAPCATFTRALSQLGTGGTILCLDALSNFGIVTISNSVTIRCSGQINGGIVINLPSSDSVQEVHLEGLLISGYNATAPGAVQIQSAGSVVLQDMVIRQASGKGVLDSRTSPGKLLIKNTVISKSFGPGVVIGGPTGNTAVLDNVNLNNNSYGVAVAAGNRVSINHCTISNNLTAGVEADGGSLVIVNGSTISNNNVGIQSGSAIRLSNSDIQFNTTGVNGATGTYGNNRFAGNGSDGTALTPVGAGSTDLAQK